MFFFTKLAMPLTVRILKQINLSSGQVTRAMGFLTKGMTTDVSIPSNSGQSDVSTVLTDLSCSRTVPVFSQPEEMERNWLRENNLVAKGQVEVLVLDRQVRY